MGIREKIAARQERQAEAENDEELQLEMMTDNKRKE